MNHTKSIRLKPAGLAIAAGAALGVSNRLATRAAAGLALTAGFGLRWADKS
jgi:hypothetical protein